MILRFTSDSSPLAEVNSEPWITRGDKVESSVDFSVNIIGILSSAILLNFSMIFLEMVASVVGFPITSDSSTTKNGFQIHRNEYRRLLCMNPRVHL